MATVIDLAERRQQRDDDGLRCMCGEAWFELIGDPDVAQNGAITFTSSGDVAGYHGRAFCVSCGRPAPLP